MRKILCIGRQFGSGGHKMAIAAAKELGINCYDREILDDAVKSSGIAGGTLTDADEKAANGWMYSILYEGADKKYYGKITNDILYDLEKKIILAAADREDCVIVGRCADVILKHHENCLVRSVFITADLEDRVKTVMTRQNLPEKAARELIRKTDKARKGYYDFYTDGDWGKPFNYDMILNSSRLSEKEIVDFLKYMYQNLN